MKIILTGATGFVGGALLNELIRKNENCLRAVVRRNVVDWPVAVKQLVVPDYSSSYILDGEFLGVNVVIHAAARVHVGSNFAGDDLEEFRSINVNGTLDLAERAADAGVRRFIFISSIKVNGEYTLKNNKFTEKSIPMPSDAYGISKYEAEVELLKLAKETGMEVVVVRPPLVYGPGVKGNFANMCNWLRRGIPLPLGAVQNQRSLVALDNLVDFVLLCADYNRSPKAANQVFLISDGVDVSTTQLLKKVGQAQGCSSRLLPVPVSLMKWGARMLGKGEQANRLLGNLQVDSRKARDWLGWQPVVTMEEQLEKMFSSNKDK